MLRPCLLVACVAFAGLLSPLSVRGDDALQQTVIAFDTAIAKLKTDELAAQAQVVEAQSKLQTLEQQKLRAERQEQSATVSHAELAKQKPDKEAAASQAQQTKSAALQALAAAEKEANALKDKADATDEQRQQAQAKVDAAKKQLEAAEKGLQGPADELLKLLESVAKNTAQVTQAQADIKRLTDEIAAASTEFKQRQSNSTTVSARRLEQQQQLQASLAAASRWVSFAGDVAPIFQQRCIACHNARTAKGRLNLESYATLVQGGESGECFTAGQPGDSLLCAVVEDGSMPQDADPLTAKQIQTLQRWVEYGGRLDAGIDAHARLIQIMPRTPQPAAPDHYPAPLAVTALAFSPNGATLATSGYHEVLLWNTTDGTLLRRLGNVAQSVYGLSFHPDGQRLAIASGTPGETGEIKVMRVADGELLADLVRVDDVMLGVAFSPDGSKLAAAGADRSIRLFDSSTYEQLVNVEDHADWVNAITWSADGPRLASASRDKTSKIFDAATGDALGTFNSHAEIVYDVAFSADGKQAISCGADKNLRLWNVADAKEVRKIAAGSGELLQLSMLADGRVASCGVEKQAKVHQSSDGKLLFALAEHPDWVYAIEVHAPTGVIATGCADGRVRLWKLANGATLREWIAAP
ncbi:MAG: c-type cytochrome domain-containing protein [Planctomycetaceae bacterium]